MGGESVRIPPATQIRRSPREPRFPWSRTQSTPNATWFSHPDKTGTRPRRDNMWFGIIVGSVIAFLVVWVGHRILLHPDRPGSLLDRQATNSAGEPQHKKETPITMMLDRVEESWESRQAAVGKGWINFVERNVRTRGTILSALVIATTGVMLVLGSSANADMARDRNLARTQPVVDATLLEFGDKDRHPTVRFGNEALMLDHGLRWEILRNIGDGVPVVEDPQSPGRLIPLEIADSPGTVGNDVGQRPDALRLDGDRRISRVDVHSPGAGRAGPGRRRSSAPGRAQAPPLTGLVPGRGDWLAARSATCRATGEALRWTHPACGECRLAPNRSRM